MQLHLRFPQILNRGKEEKIKKAWKIIPSDAITPSYAHSRGERWRELRNLK
jgi:hypothetical protein